MGILYTCIAIPFVAFGRRLTKDGGYIHDWVTRSNSAALVVGGFGALAGLDFVATKATTLVWIGG